jgi:hypothetical protein
MKNYNDYLGGGGCFVATEVVDSFFTTCGAGVTDYCLRAFYGRTYG